jgi:hypothetical protein
MSNEPLVFTLERKTQAVEIDGEQYVLRELNGQERDKYLNGLGARLVTVGDNQSIKNFDGLQASLLNLSLKKCAGDELQPVLVSTIQNWPASVQKALFDVAQKLSGLDKEEASAEGNAN